MPLYKTITIDSETIVKIWHITESFNDLITPLNLKQNSLDRVLGMKSELHQRGFLSVRHLLHSEGYSDQELFYDENGKPHLKDGKQISITHSYHFSGIIISTKNVGIDIEKQREKIVKIAHKFVDTDYDVLNVKDLSNIRKLTVIWGIKESLYKLFATPGMLFKKHFMTIPFQFDDKKTTAWIDYRGLKKPYQASFFEFEEFCCAYVVE